MARKWIGIVVVGLLGAFCAGSAKAQPMPVFDVNAMATGNPSYATWQSEYLKAKYIAGQAKPTAITIEWRGHKIRITLDEPEYRPQRNWWEEPSWTEKTRREYLKYYLPPALPVAEPVKK